MKSFEELLSDPGLANLDLNGVEITDYEIGMRLQCFLNGFELAEKLAKDKRKKSIIDLERELNEYHDRRILNDYDIHKRKMTQATKDKISKSLKAKGWKGIPLLEETRVKMRGHIVTKETRDKISKGNKGKKRSEEQRENLSLGHKGMKYKKFLRVGLN